jgi:transketolase
MVQSFFRSARLAMSHNFSHKLHRDAFLEVLFERAQKDSDIMLLSADFGAQALDRFRAELPDQFLHMGISEQNMVDVGAGLALMGKKVFLYAMAPFITTRCYEQVKAVVSSMKLPITLISVGVGLGYDHATLTHFTPEDIAIMRALNGIEVLSASDGPSAATIAHLCCDQPAFRYLRFERSLQPMLYPEGFASCWEQGFNVLAPAKDLWLAACGHMTHQALKAQAMLAEKGIEAGVIDIFRIKPLDGAELSKALGPCRRVLTLEEQLLQGGFGSAVAEALLDTGEAVTLRRIGIQDGFDVVNGNRAHLHTLYGIDLASIVQQAETFA